MAFAVRWQVRKHTARTTSRSATAPGEEGGDTFWPEGRTETVVEGVWAYRRSDMPEDWAGNRTTVRAIRTAPGEPSVETNEAREEDRRLSGDNANERP